MRLQKLFNKALLSRNLCLVAVIFGLSFAVPVYANERVAYQNWIVDIGLETTEAYTANDSGSSLGLFCGGSTCVFYLNPNLNCQPNSKNSALMNSATQSASIAMQCTLVGKHYFQMLDPFEQVLGAVKSGGHIGFAVALQGGAFSVYRFSLNGALPALQRALDESAKKRTPRSSKPSKQADSKDITL